MTQPKLLGLVVVGAIAGLAIADGARLSPLVAGAIRWLLFTAFLAFVVWLVVITRYRRRHLTESRLRDASLEPLPMRPFEQAWDADLKRFGFRYLGVLELTGPRDRPEKYWEYAHEDGLVYADISQRRGYAGFLSKFADGAMLTTRNTTLLPEVNVPFWRAVNVPGPGGSLALAHQNHRANLRPFAGVHGDVVQGFRESMADVLADEHRQMALAPELERLTNGWTERLDEVAILLFALLAWLYQGWLLVGEL